jgi:hypothetical protein
MMLTRIALTPVVFAIEAPILAFSVLIGVLFLTLGLRRPARFTSNP